jgi:sugar (pentulose or hexulose) kinase
MKYLLGIDIGTTGLKASVFGFRGSLTGRGYAANQYLSGPAGCAEQDPKTWWVGACQAIQTALNDSGVGSGRIVAIGVCGFHHCPVFLDSQGEPSRRCIVTHDVRLSESYDDLGRQGILEAVTKSSGSLVTTGSIRYTRISSYIRQYC